MSSPLIRSLGDRERPTECRHACESLYRSGATFLASGCSKLSRIFALLVGILHSLYRRRCGYGRSRRATVLYRRSLYRSGAKFLASSCSNLPRIFALLVGILYSLYRRRRCGYGRLRRATVLCKRVEVNYEPAADREGSVVSVLVTGGSGELGNSLIKCLLEVEGYRVHSLDLWIPKEGDRNPEVCSYIQADITNLDDMVVALQGVDAVFHTAGLIPTVKSCDADYYRVNTGGTETVVKACLEGGVKRLIYTSSVTAVISSDPKQDLDGVDETIPYPKAPLNAYTGSKAAAEQLVLQANGENGLVTCAMRPAGLLSHTSPFFKSCLEKSQIYIADGLLVSNTLVIPIVSAARAHILAEQKLRLGTGSVAAGKAYNLCLDEGIVAREFVGYNPNATVSVWGLPPPYSVPFWVAAVVTHLNKFIYVCTGKAPVGVHGTPMNLSFLKNPKQVFSSASAHKELGWEELPPWREIVKAFVKETEMRKQQ